MRIKICGITSEKTVAALNRFEPDFVGFVFAKSRRMVTESQAASLKTALNASVRAVGVFADHKPETIARLWERGVIDLAQLHGSEDEGYIDRLKSLIPAPVIKAIPMTEAGEFSLPVPQNCDFVLADSRGGGTGKRWNWRPLRAGKPVFLAGGIDAENAAEAAAVVRPYALDVSGGVETGGVKDNEKIGRLIEIARRIRL